MLYGGLHRLYGQVYGGFSDNITKPDHLSKYLKKVEENFYKHFKNTPKSTGSRIQTLMFDFYYVNFLVEAIYLPWMTKIMKTQYNQGNSALFIQVHWNCKLHTVC